MKRLIVSPLADADEAEILTFLATQAGPRVARAYRARFRNLYRLLTEQPGIGPPRPTLGHGVRIGIVDPYLIVYRPQRDALTILRILHGRRKITAATLRETR